MNVVEVINNWMELDECGYGRVLVRESMDEAVIKLMNAIVFIYANTY